MFEWPSTQLWPNRHTHHVQTVVHSVNLCDGRFSYSLVGKPRLSILDLFFGKCVANFSGNWWHMARVGAPYFWCCHIVEIKDDHNAICIVLWCTMAEWWWGIIGKVGGAPCASMHWSDLHCTLPCNALMWTSLQYINFLLQFSTIRSNKSVNCTMHM